MSDELRIERLERRVQALEERLERVARQANYLQHSKYYGARK